MVQLRGFHALVAGGPPPFGLPLWTRGWGGSDRVVCLWVKQWCLKLSEAWPFTRQFSLAARTPDGCLRHSLADEGGQARHAVTLRRPRQPVYVADVARKGLSRDPGLAVSLQILQGFRISGSRGQGSKRQGGEVNAWGQNKGKIIPSQGAEWHGLVGG